MMDMVSMTTTRESYYCKSHDFSGRSCDLHVLFSCWMSSNNGAIWTFVGPMIAVIVVSILVYTINPPTPP